MEALSTNPWLFPLSPSHVQRGITRPDYVRFSLIGMTLGYRINQTTDRNQQEFLAKSYCEYRGRVIQSLTRSIQAQYNQPNDLILAGIMALLLADVCVVSFTGFISRNYDVVLILLRIRPSTVYPSTHDAIWRPSFVSSACGAASAKSWRRNILIHF